MRFSIVLLATALTFSSSQAIARADGVAVATVSAKRGDVLRDASLRLVGTVSRVLDDGSLLVIFNDRFVTIPASTLATNQGKLVTSLTHQEINKL